MSTTNEMSPDKKRRGRPVGSTKSALAAAKVIAGGGSPSFVMAYVSFLSRHPLAEPTGFSVELMLKRIDDLSANILDEKSLPQRLADLTGMSLALANKVVVGAMPFTAKMVAVIAEKLDASTEYLLTGVKGQVQAPKFECAIPPDEKEMLTHYREASETGKAELMFHVSLPRLLEVLPEQASERVIASLIRLHDAGAQDFLSYLPKVLGSFKVRTGRDPLAFQDASTIFTPLHESMGIYGPEQMPLMQYLSGAGATV